MMRHCQPEFLRGGVRCLELLPVACVTGPGDDRDALRARQDLSDQLDSLGRELIGEKSHAGETAAGMCKAFRHAEFHRVATEPKNNRNVAVYLARRLKRRTYGHEHCRLESGSLKRKAVERLARVVAIAAIDDEILANYVPVSRHPFKERLEEVGATLFRDHRQPRDAVHLA